MKKERSGSLKSLRYLCLLGVVALGLMSLIGSNGDGGGGNGGGDGPQPSSAPLAPSNLTATATSSSTISLTWMDNSDNEEGFYVERSLSADSGYVQIADLGPNTESYDDSGLDPSTDYYYRVRAYNSVGDSDYSNIDSATTTSGGDTEAPSVPIGLSATAISSSRIDLSWDASTDNVAVTGYRIYRDGAFLVSVLATSYSDTGLAELTEYCYSVSAYDGEGNESGQSTTECDTTTSGGDTEAPSVPTGLSATAISSSRIDLSWDASTDNVAVTGYRIYRDGAFLVSVLATSYSDTGLAELTEYCYSVSAYDGEGNESGQSTTECDTTGSLPVPNEPTNLTATPLSSSTIRLTWTDNSDNETGFEIKKLYGFIYTKIGEVGMNVTQYDDTGLSPSTTYYYVVYAYNSSGDSTYAHASATTPAEPTTTTTFLPVRDNVVAYNSLDPNVANTAYSNADLAVGNDFTFNLLYGYDDLAMASLLYFDVSPALGKTIIRATLRLYPRILPGDWNTVYRVYALAGSWSTSVTWNSCPNSQVSPYAQQDPPITTSLPVEWDVTQIVQKWANYTWTNYGFVIWDPNYVPTYTPALRITYFESMDVYSSSSKRPALEIEYQ